MIETLPDPMLLIASEAELSSTYPAWGTGGWVSAQSREALDWLTLARLLGWSVTVIPTTDFGADSRIPRSSRFVVFGCEAEACGDDCVSYLASRLAEEPLLAIVRANGPDTASALLGGAWSRRGNCSGRSLVWTGPGPHRAWHCRNVLEVSGLDLQSDTEVWAQLEDVPIIAARRVGRGVIATLGFHPSEARDAEGVATALLKRLLIWGAPEAVAWFDFEHTLILRMDDPGGAQNIYSRNFYYPKLDEEKWTLIGRELKKRQARLSMGYISGWVDDGDASRGTLRVNDQEPPRVPGEVYPSPRVCMRTTPAMGQERYTTTYPNFAEFRCCGRADSATSNYTATHTCIQTGSRGSRPTIATSRGQPPAGTANSAHRRKQ